MTLQVHSARVSYGGPDRFDVTRKSGGPEGEPFAPSRAILQPALDARAHVKRLRSYGCEGQAASYERGAWDTYRRAFLAEMRQSYVRRRDAWAGLLARPRVVLVCYCTDPRHCHRAILRAEILPKLGAVDAGELTARG